MVTRLLKDTTIASGQAASSLFDEHATYGDAQKPSRGREQTLQDRHLRQRSTGMIHRMSVPLGELIEPIDSPALRAVCDADAPRSRPSLIRLEHDASTKVPPGASNGEPEPGQPPVGLTRRRHLRLLCAQTRAGRSPPRRTIASRSGEQRLQLGESVAADAPRAGS